MQSPPAIIPLLLLLLSVQPLHSYRILGIIPTPSISHQLPFRLIALELARRGHQVTLMTTDPIKKNIANYTEIDLSESYDFWGTFADFTSMHDSSPVAMMKIFPSMGEGVCNVQLNSPQVKNFLKSKQTFDVVILEQLCYQCYYGLIHHLGSPPLVGFVSFGAPSTLYQIYGNPNNPAYSPDLLIGYTDHMSFWQRLHNTYIIQRLLYEWNYNVVPSQEAVLRAHFGPDPPPVTQTDRNFSLLLANNHFSMNYPRPLLPNIVELTGLHLEKERKPLPGDIKNFLDGAEQGAIYFSLGSNVKASTMPEEKRLAFLKAFAQLPQRVLWKWETGSMADLPPNVMVSKWLPQQDVLAHQNIRLFITQGGLQSMNEAGYFAVPLIGIPFMGDQQHNVAKMVQAGIGYQLLFKDVTENSILQAIKTVLSDETYRENMKRFSTVFCEHQETSLERAVWWVEYVVRHQGAPHLRSAALDLHWWQLLLLDVVAFVVVTAGLALYVTYRVVCYVNKSLHITQKLKAL